MKTAQIMLTDYFYKKSNQCFYQIWSFDLTLFTTMNSNLQKNLQNSIYISIMKAQTRSRTLVKSSANSRALPITIFPRDVTFEDVQSHSCYQITLYIRNEGKEMQKLRVIEPASKLFKVKMDQNFTKTLAPGLTIKLNVIFTSEKLADQTCFEDQLMICGNSFKEIVSLKAYPPREQFIIPTVWNLGRLIVNRDNIGLVPIRNQGKKVGRIECDKTHNPSATLIVRQLKIEAGESKNIELKIKSKKIGNFQETLSFSNGRCCIIKGVFVEECIDILNSEGQRLNIIDLGQIFIGQRAQQSYFILNNTENSIDCIFKSFNKNVQVNDLKVDCERGNFIIKSLPQDYAKELKTCYASSKHQRCTIKRFQQFENKLIVNRFPDVKEQRLFQAYANGQVMREAMEQPIIESLVIKISANKNYTKVPIKFISVFPRIKISESVVDFGEIKERTDNIREIKIQNEGQKDIRLHYENSEMIRIETNPVVKPRSSHNIKVILRAVKAGNINEIAKIKLFEGLFLEIKVFACCRSSSIRAKKITNINSARQLRKGFPLYQTLTSPTNLQKINMAMTMDSFNKTDVLADLRTLRLNKLLKEHIQSQNQPTLRQPQLSMRFQQLDNNIKHNPFMRKLKKDFSCPKITLKEMTKFTNALKTDQLSNIIIKDNEIAFGNIFINTELLREVRVMNNNSEAILFEWDFGNSECLRGANCEMTKIDAFTQKVFNIYFRPNSLGAISLPLQYIINRSHIFQTTVTAYVTLINVEISSKNLQYCFSSQENEFEKAQQLEIINRSDNHIRCQIKFQDNKHFYVQNETLAFPPRSQQKVKVLYRPTEGDETGVERTDTDKLIIKVIGGAQNTIKCTGFVNDAKVTIKESQIIYSNYLVSTPLTGKFNIKNHSKLETILRIEVPNEIKDIINFEKEQTILNGEQKKQITYTIVCNQAKRVNSAILLHIRGTKVIRIPVDINFMFPEIVSNRDVIDFGSIPIMGSNYQETLILVNMFKSQVKLQFSKKFQNEDYSIEIRQFFKTKTQQSLIDVDVSKSKKKQSNYREDNKKVIANQKIFRLLPNVEVCLEVKFIPKKLQQFDIPIPLKLSGTTNLVVQPLKVRLVCSGIEPVVYLHPHKIAFDTRIIGEGKSSFTKTFQIRNPHEFDIDWSIEPQQITKTQCFYLSQERGRLSAKNSVHVEVMFKPQQQGHFLEKMDVVLRQKKTYHISLELEGNALLPSIKFNCNQIIMPVVPLGIESKSFVILQNKGYDAITISKWKTTTHFQSVDIGVNFVQGRLLSLAKKNLKVQVAILSTVSISLTTFLEFYDEFGSKYEIPISFTADNSLMTAYPYLQSEKSIVYLQKKEGVVKISDKNHPPNDLDGGVRSNQAAYCQFIKSWLNYEINLSIKSFPGCIINSQGELMYRMINRISTLDLVRRFETNNNEPLYSNIHAYYSECIKMLKVQGAYLNQIRPQFLLSYKDYKAYLISKNSFVENQQNFEILSVNSWIALFYQLVKLYIMPHLNEKIINKFSSSSAQISGFYSNTQLLVFKFLNAFNNDDPFYDLGDQVKFFQIFQQSFEKVFNLNFTNSILSLKMTSLFMTPSLFSIIISKFLSEKLKEYGLCQFLSEIQLFSLGAKEIMLTMVTYITMLYHYSNSINVCFQASIGDKITKIIQIENPVGRKAKYKLKLLGSQEFQLENQEVNFAGRGKAQARVAYHCKQNKPQEAKLLLIPIKQDNTSSVVQPMSFKLTTSILSKITLKKLQITARLYEITNITLEVQLPMDIIDLCQFNVSLNQAEEGVKSFYCFSQMTRILRNNRDKLEIKLIPLTLESKFCRVCYRSSAYGQFNFEITAKIETSPCLKQVRMKQLKVNKDEIVSVYLPRENEQLSQALRFLNEHHVKLDYMTTTKKTIPLNKYSISIVESSYISIVDEYSEILRNTLDGKDSIRVDLKCNFGKPFNEYTCTMMIRNDILKDIRFYKLITSVAMKPKIIPISVRARAQESATIKIPIKIAPCECSIEGAIEQFSITNFSSHLKQSIEFIGVFTPDWMLQKEVNIIAQNKDTLEQLIYCISLKADEPAFFDNIKLEGSTVFEKKIKIPLSLTFSQDLRVETNSRRIILDDKHVNPHRKWINAIILPSDQEDMSNIKLIKEKTGHYYWASLFIANKKLEGSININLEEKSNTVLRHVLQQIPLGDDYQIDFQSNHYLNYDVISKNGQKFLELVYSPQKEMEVSQKLHLMINSSQYAITVNCKCPALPIVIFPEIFSYNLAEKSSSLILLNPSDIRGVYRATLEPSDVFSLDSSQFELKGHEKKQIKIYFAPLSLQTRYKAVLKFECQTLPTYEYHLNGISEFDSCEKAVDCQIYSDRQILTDLLFTNNFAKTEDFVIETHFTFTPFELVEPTHSIFRLEPGVTKKIIVKSKKCDRIDMQEGLLQIRLGQRRWKYRLNPIVIKNFTSKKYNWHCKARDIIYESLELPDKIIIKSLQSPAEISPYLTFTLEQGSNALKLKYSPLKPVPKQQYQVFLLADKSKYVINCVVSVSQPDFDDTILIKTKEINECGCVSFKLTNIKKISAPFKAYFMKGQADLSIETQKNYLEGYGRPGTVIKIKFVSNVYNKRVEDELWIETNEMLWRFKVKGIVSKKIQTK